MSDSTTKWVAMQIMAIKRTQEPAAYNPRPRGVLQPGSATSDVLNWLRTKERGSWWLRAQIIDGTGRTRKSVDWALIFLLNTGRVRALDAGRFARFMRYQATTKTDEQAGA